MLGWCRGWRCRPGRSGRAGAPVVLDTRRIQAPNAVRLESLLPGEELLLRQLVKPAGFLESDLTAAHCRHDRSFAAGHPPLGIRRR